MIRYFFKKPHQIPPDILEKIQYLINRHGGVLTGYLEENLLNAFLVGYAMDGESVIGTSIHKYQKKAYREKIEKATKLNLSGYLERGYTTVDPEYREQDIAHKLIKGLIQRSKGKKIYVTIRMDNIAPLKLTYKNGMTLAATYRHHKTGNELGVFINQKSMPDHGEDPKKNLP